MHPGPFLGPGGQLLAQTHFANYTVNHLNCRTVNGKLFFRLVFLIHLLILLIFAERYVNNYTL